MLGLLNRGFRPIWPWLATVQDSKARSSLLPSRW